MKGWTETWRGIVAPWECDLTEHFTIAYYFDRLADAASAIGASLGLIETSRSAKRRFDVRFVRELRAGASFHILSVPIALDEGHVRLGHQIIDSADGVTTAWVEETIAIGASQLTRDARDAVNGRLLPWPGPTVEQRPEPSTTHGFSVTVRDRVKPLDLDADGNLTLAAFVHRFTAASMQGLAAIGATAGYLHTERRGYSTFELALRITRSPQLGSALLVETGIVHLGNSSIRFLHRMIDPTEGSELASLSQFGVQLDLDTRRPASLSEPLRLAATRLVVPVGYGSAMSSK